MFLKLSKHWGLEFNIYFWNIFEDIKIGQSIHLKLKGDHKGLYLMGDLLFFGYDLEIYDNRHEKEFEDIYDESGYIIASMEKQNDKNN